MRNLCNSVFFGRFNIYINHIWWKKCSRVVSSLCSLENDFLGHFHRFSFFNVFCFGWHSAQANDFWVNSVIFRFYKLWAFIWAAIWVDSLKNSRDRSKTITQHPKILVEKVEEKFFIFDFSQKKRIFFEKILYHQIRQNFIFRTVNYIGRSSGK